MIVALPKPETVENCALADSVVPSELPPTQPTPSPARPTNFLIAFMTYWMNPVRIGPHLAKGSFLTALSAAILGQVLCALIVCTAPLWGRGDWVQCISSLREMLAEVVIGLATASTSANWNWIAIVGVLLIPLELLGAILVSGIFLFPWAADGDSIRSATGRSVKMALWNATLLPLLSLIWVASRWALSQIPMTGMQSPR